MAGQWPCVLQQYIEWFRTQTRSDLRLEEDEEKFCLPYRWSTIEDFITGKKRSIMKSLVC